MNVGGQFAQDSSIRCEEFLCRGSGTEGGLVVHCKAVKYRHNAGPGMKRFEQRVRKK
jgi:hypothetical protein